MSFSLFLSIKGRVKTGVSLLRQKKGRFLSPASVCVTYKSRGRITGEEWSERVGRHHMDNGPGAVEVRLLRETVWPGDTSEGCFISPPTAHVILQR